MWQKVKFIPTPIFSYRAAGAIIERCLVHPPPTSSSRARRLRRRPISPTRRSISTASLSWLAFNQRVLDQANDPAHPLLERVKFLSIAASNLDEFYMVRVATLLKKFRAGMDDVSPDGLHTEQQLVAIRQRAAQMLDDMATCWQEQLRPQLEADGIRLLEPQDYTPEAQAFLSRATSRATSGRC